MRQAERERERDEISLSQKIHSEIFEQFLENVLQKS